MGLLLMLMTIGGLGVAAILLISASMTKSSWLAKFVGAAVGVWAVIYMAALVGTSLMSREKEIAVGDTDGKQYCGFYIDCHMHAAVTGVRTAKAVGSKTAKGEFYIVNVQVFSNAKNPNINLRLINPDAGLVDDHGSRYERDLEAETGLPTAAVDLGRDVRSSEILEKEIVFDVPAGIRGPRLDITEGYGIDKLIEAFLVGDEDSFLHKRTYFRLPDQVIARGVE